MAVHQLQQMIGYYVYTPAVEWVCFFTFSTKAVEPLNSSVLNLDKNQWTILIHKDDAFTMEVFWIKEDSSSVRITFANLQ